MSNEPQNPPILQAPGAGLPWVELQIGKLIFKSQLLYSNPGSRHDLIESELAEILHLSRNCSEDAGTRRVLIRRLPGMEDSSRFWSVLMAVQHLQIVNSFVADTLSSLERGETPSRIASTASVKPPPDADHSALAGLEAACASIRNAAEKLGGRRPKGRHAHPWFGPLDAEAWHFLAGFHMRLHRKQIEAILRSLGLPGANPEKIKSR